jgi:hypothetical protein
MTPTGLMEYFDSNPEIWVRLSYEKKVDGLVIARKTQILSTMGDFDFHYIRVDSPEHKQILADGFIKGCHIENSFRIGLNSSPSMTGILELYHWPFRYYNMDEFCDLLKKLIDKQIY